MSKSPFLVSNFNIKSVKEDDAEFYIVEGYASIYGNIDSYRDIVMPGAFAKDLLESGTERPILWQHNSSQPIGVGLFEEKQEGLFVKIKMPKESDFVAKEVMPLIKCGAVKGMSIGYWTMVEEWDQNEKVNRLKELKLRENSIVTFPANELAQITAAKQFLGLDIDQKSTAFKMYPFMDEKTPWDKNKAVKMIRENTGSDEEPTKNYKKGFMYYDSEKADDYTAYKMPYVYWDDGKFKIVPKAIYAIAGSLAGARGGVSIPDADKEKIKGYVNQVYKKLGKEEPFKGKSIFIDTATLKNMEDQDKEIIFSPDVILSTGAKSEIIKSLRSPAQGGSVTEKKTDLLDFLKKANEDMEINK